MTAAEHWDGVYEATAAERLSWFEPSAGARVADVLALDLPRDAPILDAGGGASRLTAELQRLGYSDLTVADISSAALERARGAVARPEQVDWVVADLRTHRFGRRFALWHDRAVLHFMVGAADLDAYVDSIRGSVAAGGHLLISTFGPDGPTRCSGLPAARYDAEGLAALFAPWAVLRSHRLEEHVTPSGRSQQFLCTHLTVAG